MKNRTILNSIDSTFYKKNLERKVGCSLDELLAKISEFIPESSGPYLSKESFRLVENWRSISIPLANDYHLIIKGSELLANDVFKIYQKTMNQFYEIGEGSNSDHFFFKEGKIPMLVTYDEAFNEFEVSMKVFLDYFNKFKNIPSLPIPLAVFNYEHKKIKGSGLKLKNYLNDLYKVNISNEQLGGIGYIYKGHPARVKHWKQYCENPKLNRLQWQEGQAVFFNSNKLFDSYIKLFAELTSLDWILTPIGQEHLGYCVKSQNMTLVGGFIDLGNAYKVANELSKRDVIAFLKSIQILCESLMDISYPKGRVSNNLGHLLIANQLLRALSKELKKINSNSLLSIVYIKFIENGYIDFSEQMNSILDDDLRENFKIVI